MHDYRCRKLVGNVSSSKWGGTGGKGAAPRPGKGVRGGRIPFHRRSPVPPYTDRLVTAYGWRAYYYILLWLINTIIHEYELINLD